ncbi:NAD(P)/FAD-dependent oxidoreductase [Microbacterium ulmi]|uniref:FAD-dependent oxidoreductase n=1 Tax=Microbacterium ulmi TaxID=179095 RepID=A0A7Y2M117_9MICO|nr:FAD-dependent oxidoreductase [Microbacterium ulmi]NII70223.1 sulfide:quinone oxidoreductase [Microbacterium ulmi]NNH04516.1 FAD-dependent oxidoreductase [Microbacterium ulmi]
MAARVLVLGAGFGGLELTSTLAEELGGEVQITLVDRTAGFVFGFSKLDVMFGRADAGHVVHPYADLAKPGVTFVRAEITAIDATTRRVETTAGAFQADYLVVALGADYDVLRTRGLAEAGHEFYSERGAFALRETLAEFEGGDVVVGVTAGPFKCPPAPSETALMLDAMLRERGIRDSSTISLVMPVARPLPPSEDASAALLEAFAERGIAWHPDTGVRSLDVEERVARLGDGSALPFDLYLGVPVHRVPVVVEAAGLTVDGWIPVDPRTLETPWPDVFAVGDCAAVGTPRAGAFAERQGAAAARIIAARVRGERTDAAYDGRGVCYIEFGGDEIGRVEVSFFDGHPAGAFEGPSLALAADKQEFGASRIRRWFGREWTPVG